MMGNDIWSGNEPFLEGHSKKKSSHKGLIGTSIFIVVLITFFIISNPSDNPEEFEQPLENEFVVDDFEEYRNLTAEELLAQLNNEKGFKEKNPLREIDMIARKFVFEPNVINAKLNDRVVITIRSADIDHDITIPAFFVMKQLPATEDVKIEFIASKTGEFRFSSKVNENMVGKIVITEDN